MLPRKTAKLSLERHGIIDCGCTKRPQVFGIINLTPDSFSDGGSYKDVPSAVECACRMLDEGAFGIDAGAESTRPGAEYVSETEEIRRLIPFLEAFRAKRPDAVISADTRKSAVADAALKAGADLINDVSAMRFDQGMGNVVAERSAGIILMHSRGTPQTMKDPEFLVYEDLIREVTESLGASAERAMSCGIAQDRILLDPGIGFAKTPEQDFELVRQAYRLRTELGFPLFYGPSRKSFLKKVLPDSQARERDGATLGVLGSLALSGVEFVRVHNVRAAVSFLDAFVRSLS